jgi:hypothetical protein
MKARVWVKVVSRKGAKFKRKAQRKTSSLRLSFAFASLRET